MTRSRLQTVVPIGLMLFLAIIVTNVFPFRVILAQETKVEVAQESLADLEAENARLQNKIEALSTDTELERIARKDLGYVREGEIAYVITTPSDYVPVAEPTIVIPERRAWWRVVADFLTGEDLVSR
ncbi:MAG: septum formation initiator family protein [Acidimicrobiia bacterium]|nr:septum formation initiator family protein [Acidimicrobiia bacterium]MDH5420765.1 septum formation initiator family protein [Acidimicrobiia bacterium]MDH5502418.1 septum formation initiator family protein [Acidimicrobiia bacterium]